MNRICGNGGTAELRALDRAPGAAVRVLAVAVLTFVLAAPPAALAAGGSGSAPSPQRLWRKYPLDSAHAGRIRPPAHTATQSSPAARAAPSSSSTMSLGAWLGITVGALAVAVATYALVWQSALRASLPFGERAQAAVRRRTRKTSERARPTSRAASAAPLGDRKVEAAARTAILLQPKANGRTREATVLKRKKPVQARTREETVLKRKQPTSERAVQALKEKRPAASDKQEVGVLKEKLAPRPPEPRELAPASLPAAPPPCRIEWWRGYVKSEFHAKLRGPDGNETILRSSPPFRWSKSTPPPKDLPHAARAHAALVAELKAEGWVARGCGEHWYALELQPRQVPAGAERAT